VTFEFDRRRSARESNTDIATALTISHATAKTQGHQLCAVAGAEFGHGT
jgi:hypothetical protein